MFLFEMIWSTTTLAAINSLPYVAVSTVGCFLQYQSNGVLFMRCEIPVTDLPVRMS